MAPGMFRSARRQRKAARQLVNDFQSESAEIEGAPDPVSARLTLHTIVFMFAAAIALALTRLVPDAPATVRSKA